MQTSHTILSSCKQLAEIHIDNLQTANTAKIFLSNNFQCLLLWKFTREFSTLRMFTTFKQFFCNLINNAYHVRRRFIWLLTNIQTTSLQMINHNKQSHQPINNINHIANNLINLSTTSITLQTISSTYQQHRSSCKQHHSHCKQHQQGYIFVNIINHFANNLNKQSFNLPRFIQAIYKQQISN